MYITINDLKRFIFKKQTNKQTFFYLIYMELTSCSCLHSYIVSLQKKKKTRVFDFSTPVK